MTKGSGSAGFAKKEPYQSSPNFFFDGTIRKMGVDLLGLDFSKACIAPSRALS